MSDKKVPGPEEIQEEIEKMMKDKFGENIQIVTQAMPHMDEVVDAEEVEDLEEEKSIDLNFDFMPKQIKEYLDKYVVGQDQAKKAIAIAVCDHYNHVRECQYRKENNIEFEENYSKQNVIMLGPTGVGKTYLVRTLAKLIGVPFVKADATRFTETGYVGANVDDMVRDLVSMANDNLDMAQYGIIYFDEVDKLAGNGSTNGGKGISGQGVQYALLKLMEETEIDLTSGNDMISQLRAFMDFQRKGKVAKKVINTKHILFIVSGAFSGLEDIVSKRLKLSKIGFIDNKKKHGISEEDIFNHATTKDFIDFGFEPEFIGRLPVRLACHDLSIENLFEILKNTKGSIVSQYIRSFKAYGIEMSFEDDALKRIAELAYEEKTGARGLMTICEKLFRDYKFELPSTDRKGFMVTRELVDDPSGELVKILAGEYLGGATQN